MNDLKWIDVPYSNGWYQINTNGEVRSVERFVSRNGVKAKISGRVLKPSNGIDGYPYVTLNYSGRRERFKLHRLVAKTYISNYSEILDVDHINGNRSDNRLKNLRMATRSQNRANSKSRVNSSSQYKGVSWSKQKKCWRADIMLNGEHIYLGLYGDELEAANAYDVKAIALYGEYARTNKMIEKESNNEIQ